MVRIGRLVDGVHADDVMMVGLEDGHEGEVEVGHPAVEPGQDRLSQASVPR